MNLCIIIGSSLTKALVNFALSSVAGLDFEVFLRRTAEGIIDRAVRDVIAEADRIVFEEETSDVIA